MFVGLVFDRLHVFPIKSVRTKQDGSINVVLLEALAGRSVWFGGSDVNPRMIQRGLIGGPGRG